MYTGTLGPSIRTIVPVRDGSGRIVGLVAAGITQQTLAERWRTQWLTIAVVGAGALAMSLVGVWAIRRRLLRQTHGLRPDELRVMYEHHDAILHSVSEGLVVLDRTGVALVNDEARRLLGLPPGPVTRSDLPEFLRTYNPGARDEVHVTDERVLVVNRSQVDSRSQDSEVVTIRDRTELQGALGELSALQVLTDSLRSQAHEAANKLHTVITMVEMGRSDEAVTFATNELELSQRLVDRLSTDVGEPALVALLLGKTAQADERGIELSVTEETHLPSNTDDVPLSGQEMVTVLGNLIDNAMDACDRDDPWVEVTVNQDDSRLLIRVADSGSGMDAATFEKAMHRGYSTKSGLRRRTARPRAGPRRAGRQAAQRHADRRRDVRLGGHGDGERLMINVLIVEDEPLIAEAHQAYLQRLEGFSVAAVAHTARDAMRAAADAAADETPIDLVLLDIGLPDASGITLASGLSGLRPTPDIIAITSERDLEMVRAAVGHGALAYLLKPFTFAAFRDRLERYKRYREALPAGTDAASQAEVDRALAELRISTDKSVAPKGAAAGTNDEIARAVRDSADGITADAVAKQVGVSRVTAWRYLERLADEGTVTRHTDYGKAGRPKTRYQWR